MKQARDKHSLPCDGFSVDTANLQRQGLLRKERIITARDGVRVQVDGRDLINFCSNDYLGLANHPGIAGALKLAAERFGTGSSASPLVSGKTGLHRQLEETLAGLTGRDRALLLSCGYMANHAIFSGLVRSRQDEIYEDRLCHASMIDGAIASPARLRRYRHADPVSLESLLARSDRQRKLVLTESVFSMDGDIAPLDELARVSRTHRACLIVDDAHGFGVLGRRGLGGLEHFALGQNDVALMMATFGKAFGVYGAFVAGSETLLETFVQQARPYIYSTALPAPIVAAIQASLQIHQDESWRRERLGELIRRFRLGADQLGLNSASSETPIQPVIIGSADRAAAAAGHLEKKGLFVIPIRPPTVPANTARLRITLSAGHSPEQVDMLLDALDTCMKQIRAGSVKGEP